MSQTNGVASNGSAAPDGQESFKLFPDAYGEVLVFPRLGGGPKSGLDPLNGQLPNPQIPGITQERALTGDMKDWQGYYDDLLTPPSELKDGMGNPLVLPNPAPGGTPALSTPSSGISPEDLGPLHSFYTGHEPPTGPITSAGTPSGHGPPDEQPGGPLAGAGTDLTNPDKAAIDTWAAKNAKPYGNALPSTNGTSTLGPYENAPKTHPTGLGWGHGPTSPGRYAPPSELEQPTREWLETNELETWSDVMDKFAEQKFIGFVDPSGRRRYMNQVAFKAFWDDVRGKVDQDGVDLSLDVLRGFGGTVSFYKESPHAQIGEQPASEPIQELDLQTLQKVMFPELSLATQPISDAEYDANVERFLRSMLSTLGRHPQQKMRDLTPAQKVFSAEVKNRVFTKQLPDGRIVSRTPAEQEQGLNQAMDFILRDTSMSTVAHRGLIATLEGLPLMSVGSMLGGGPQTFVTPRKNVGDNLRSINTEPQVQTVQPTAQKERTPTLFSTPSPTASSTPSPTVSSTPGPTAPSGPKIRVVKESITRHSSEPSLQEGHQVVQLTYPNGTTKYVTAEKFERDFLTIASGGPFDTQAKEAHLNEKLKKVVDLTSAPPLGKSSPDELGIPQEELEAENFYLAKVTPLGGKPLYYRAEDISKAVFSGEVALDAELSLVRFAEDMWITQALNNASYVVEQMLEDLEIYRKGPLPNGLRQKIEEAFLG